MHAEMACDDVAALLAWELQPAGRELLQQARKVEQRHRLGGWDSLIVAVARPQDCGTLLTEDLQSGMVFGEVTVRSPFQPVAEEPRTAHATGTGVARRHRPRGRPRKRSGAAP